MFRFLQKKEKIEKELALKPKKGYQVHEVYLCTFYFVASLFFVVNCFDHYFTSPREENNPDEKGVKNDVVSAFSDVNKSDVYPVSGQWAFHAHISKIDPDNDTAKQIVNDACMYYKRRRSLRQEDNEIDAVIEISGFCELEKRYVIMRL